MRAKTLTSLRKDAEDLVVQAKRHQEKATEQQELADRAFHEAGIINDMIDRLAELVTSDGRTAAPNAGQATPKMDKELAKKMWGLANPVMSAKVVVRNIADILGNAHYTGPLVTMIRREKWPEHGQGDYGNKRRLYCKKGCGIASSTYPCEWCGAKNPCLEELASKTGKP